MQDGSPVETPEPKIELLGTSGWNNDRSCYCCMDLTEIAIRQEYAQYRFESRARPGTALALWVPRYGLVYRKLAGFRTRAVLAAANALLSRAGEELRSCAEDARTLAFPYSIRVVGAVAFLVTKMLRAVVMNEQVERLEQGFCGAKF